MQASQTILLILPLVGALLAQTSCRVAPNEIAPRPAGAPVGIKADRAPSQAQASASVADPPTAHGWPTLEDPVLDRLFERALAQNLSSQAAFSRVRASRAADGWQQGFDATWEIPLLAQSGRHGTAGDRVAPADERNEAMVSLLAEVARDYLELRILRHRSDLAIDNLVIQKDVLELTRSLADQRLAVDRDVSRAQNQMGQCRAAVAPIQDGIARSKQAIAILLDQDPDALSAKLDGQGQVPAIPSLPGAHLSSDLLRRRPDVRRAERWIEATNAHVAAALAHAYPKFILAGSFAGDSARFSAAIVGASRSLHGRPGASWDPSDFGRTAALAAHVTGNQPQALLAYQYTLLSALRDVEDALAAFHEEQEHERRLIRAVDEASQALEGSRGRYLTDLAQSRQALAMRGVALYKALGGGWETPDSADPHRTRAGSREASPGVFPINANPSCHGDRT